MFPNSFGRMGRFGRRGFGRGGGFGREGFGREGAFGLNSFGGMFGLFQVLDRIFFEISRQV